MKTTEITDYDKQALDFLVKHGVEFKAEFLKNGKHFEGDKDDRDIYLITLKRDSRSYSFNFVQSIVNSGFYYKKGKKIVNLDRNKITPNGQKLIELTETQLKNYIKIKLYDWDFMPKTDTVHFPVASPNTTQAPLKTFAASLDTMKTAVLPNACIKL